MSKIVLVGGSSGALEALKVILGMLPADFPAAILIVKHIGSQKSMLAEILGPCSAMPVRTAIDGEPIIPGSVLVAPSDHHLTVFAKDGRAHVRLLHGPKENHCRPAIDPLFRSAAALFLNNAIGVVLSGYLDDGTVGLQAIKACGGLAIVQDPTDAEAIDMPASALEHVNIDRVLRVSQIAPALVELAAMNALPGSAMTTDAGSGVPAWINLENRMVGRESDMDELDRIGKASALTCPECNGALWETGDKGFMRYRCHTGHAFTAKVLETLQLSAAEDAIWGAIRALHEQERLFSKLCERERQAGRAECATEYGAKAAQVKLHAQTLREMVAARAFRIQGMGSLDGSAP